MTEGSKMEQSIEFLINYSHFKSRRKGEPRSRSWIVLVCFSFNFVLNRGNMWDLLLYYGLACVFPELMDIKPHRFKKEQIK
jgi:hypothetical protein